MMHGHTNIEFCVYCKGYVGWFVFEILMPSHKAVISRGLKNVSGNPSSYKKARYYVEELVIF